MTDSQCDHNPKGLCHRSQVVCPSLTLAMQLTVPGPHVYWTLTANHMDNPGAQVCMWLDRQTASICCTADCHCSKDRFF